MGDDGDFKCFEIDGGRRLWLGSTLNLENHDINCSILQ